jgi:hypothetical protein
LALAILGISFYRGTRAICPLVSLSLVALSSANALEGISEAESPRGKSGAKHDYSRFQLPFVFQFLLRLFENTVVDDSVQGKLLIDDPAANVFVEHYLNAIYGDRQI